MKPKWELVKVLFAPRPDWEVAFGGDTVQMNATANHLREMGITVDISRPERVDVKRYDVIHLWTSLQMPGEFINDVKGLQHVRPQTKIVQSPVWAPQHTLRWMTFARNWLFERHPNLEGLTLDSAAEDLHAISRRSLAFQTPQMQVRPFDHDPLAIRLRQGLECLDMILPNSWMELQAIHEHIGVVCDFHIVPNAVDTALFLEGEMAPVPDYLRETPFALMSARFDSRKQQDFVLLALNDLDIPLVFVGAVAEQPIFDRFKALGSKRRAPVYYFPRVDQAALRPLYACASVHFLPSIFESPGLSSIEAALLDCSLVVGGIAFETEYFRNEAYYCDPCDAWSIRRAVKTAFENHGQDVARRETLRNRILEQYTWQHAAAETARAYSRVCER